MIILLIKLVVLDLKFMFFSSLKTKQNQKLRKKNNFTRCLSCRTIILEYEVNISLNMDATMEQEPCNNRLFLNLSGLTLDMVWCG